ncbi:MAG: PD-(D/E)XK nuclease domain-containing protein [Sarcina sp.]
MECEEKTGKGYADFTFHPKRKRDTPIIIELKKNEKAEVAINQIIGKEYYKKFVEEYNKVLIVAITYNTKMKEHTCIMKVMKGMR